ncbi:MAG: M48 family metalloprotease, partial [Actinobacteria bacterium]|nr:M48 family metalloprotease [Actinomycetota bacterium]
MRRRTLMAALVLVAAGVWIVAVALLWRSSVPDGLRLPAVDLHAVFSDAELSRAARFARFERVLWVLSQVALVGVLAVYAARGARFARESAAGPIGTGMLLGMLGFALVWLVQVPFQLASLWWERRYGISKAGYLDVLLEGWFGLGATFLFLCLALLIVMALARVMGDRWWLLGGPAFVGLAALFLLVSPYLLPNTHRLDDPALLADARAYERAEGVGPIRIDVQDVSELTEAANAMALGVGPTRRIVLWDTLLEFPRPQASFVLAHEIAHHSRNHLPKGLAWYALFAVPGAWAIARATRRRGGMRDPLAVPLSLLVLVVLQLAALPLQNVI